MSEFLFTCCLCHEPREIAPSRQATCSVEKAADGWVLFASEALPGVVERVCAECNALIVNAGAAELVAELRADRDALLAAVKLARDAIAESRHSHQWREALIALSTAIGRVRGEAAAAIDRTARGQ